MTGLLHQLQSFEARMPAAERDYPFSSTAAQAALAENFVGLPL